MAKCAIKAVLFDLGETLLNFGRIDTKAVFKDAAGRSYDYLKQTSQPVGPLWRYLWRSLGDMRLRILLSDITGNDFDSFAVFKAYGAKRGFTLTDEQWERFNWLWYEPLYEIAMLEADLAETLAKLQEAGLKLGIVSNTFVNCSALERHLAGAGVLDFFQVRMYSYQFPFRKPDKRIFLEAARQIGHDPEEIVYVGDRIDKDVNGALRVGMTPVLKTAYTSEGKTVPGGVNVIDRIAELPQVVSSLISRDSQPVSR